MENIALDTAFVDQGIPHVAFWNGRVLTAEDLRGEQLASQLSRNRLGRAIGSGVVAGLSVQPGADATAVNVAAGLAVDRNGQVVELPVDVSLSLVVPSTTAQGDGVFTVCEPIASSSPTGTGLYLLVIRPASDSRSSVAGVPALGAGVATECGPRYTVDGVSFRLIGVDPIPLAEAAGHDQADLEILAGLGTATVASTARNVLAHLFLDTLAWADRLLDPFGADPASVEFGALASLGVRPVRPCEVPIALLTWSSGGVSSVDMWAVRRAPSPEPALSAVQGLGGTRREQLGRASYCQFQDELALIMAELLPSERTAFRLEQRFRYLPAAGLVPIARADRPGFSANVFGSLVVRGPMPLDPVRVGPLLDESFHHVAVDASAGEVLNIYSVPDPGTGDLDHLVFCTERIDVIDQVLAIDAVFPSGTLHLGDRIDIRGRNFGFTTGHARVDFGGQNADALFGSTDARLIVRVPSTLEVEPSGSVVRLQVSSNRGADAVPVIIAGRQQPAGLLHVSWLSADPAAVIVGQDVVLHYAVRSAMDSAVEVQLDLKGLKAVADVATMDANGAPVTGPIPMNPGDEVFVNVTISPVPRVPNFTLTLAATAGDVAEDDTRLFVADARLTPSDPAIRIETVGLDVDPGSMASRSGSTISLADGSVATVEATVRLTDPGPYEVSVGKVDPRDPWRAVLAEPAPDVRGTGAIPLIDPGEFAGDGVAERRVRVSFRVSFPRDGRTPSPRMFTLTLIRHGGGATSRTYTLQALKSAPPRPNGKHP
jgi:hypothetical protein